MIRAIVVAAKGARFENEGIEFACPTQTVFVERDGGKGTGKPA